MDPHELQQLRIASSRLATVTDIRETRFEAISAELVDDVLPDHQLTFNVEPSIEYSKLSDGNFTVRAEYKVTMSQRPSGTDADVPATEFARFSVQLAGLFRVDDSRDNVQLDAISEEEIAAYAGSMGRFALHPYARAEIGRLVANLGLPPFTLPTLKIATGEMGD